MTNARSQRGLTMIETLVVSVLTLMGLASLAGLLTSTDTVQKDSLVRTRAESEHRRNLRMLATVLRAADVATMSGFDADGISRVPTFSRVTGVDLENRIYGDLERLEWRPMTRPVDGITRPGAVWLVSPAGARMVADRVPEGGFQVRHEGTKLAIRLTTFYSSTVERAVQVTSETAVSLRN